MEEKMITIYNTQAGLDINAILDQIHDFLDFASDIAIDLERYALDVNGLAPGFADDTIIAEFINDVDETYGSDAADFITQVVDDVIQGLGERLLPAIDKSLNDLQSINIDLSDGQEQRISAYIPDMPYILLVGDPRDVGGGDLSDIIRTAIDGDADDSDVEQLFLEILSGVSGANLEKDFQPGINGVELVDLTSTSYSLSFEDSGNTHGATRDLIEFRGPGVEAFLTDVNAPANFVDFRNSFKELF
jgi:hypothetical protein